MLGPKSISESTLSAAALSSPPHSAVRPIDRMSLSCFACSSHVLKFCLFLMLSRRPNRLYSVDWRRQPLLHSPPASPPPLPPRIPCLQSLSASSLPISPSLLGASAASKRLPFPLPQVLPARSPDGAQAVLFLGKQLLLPLTYPQCVLQCCGPSRFLEGVCVVFSCPSCRIPRAVIFRLVGKGSRDSSCGSLAAQMRSK